MFQSAKYADNDAAQGFKPGVCERVQTRGPENLREAPGPIGIGTRLADGSIMAVVMTHCSSAEIARKTVLF